LVPGVVLGLITSVATSQPTSVVDQVRGVNEKAVSDPLEGLRPEHPAAGDLSSPDPEAGDQLRLGQHLGRGIDS
jgi:hypothetical protein